jgi:hypothetical protein
MNTIIKLASKTCVSVIRVGFGRVSGHGVGAKRKIAKVKMTFELEWRPTWIWRR